MRISGLSYKANCNGIAVNIMKKPLRVPSSSEKKAYESSRDYGSCGNGVVEVADRRGMP